jgi:long-chain fatty acid transport protein
MTMPAEVEMKGTIKVKDFQWPQTFGLGASYQVNDRLMLAGDVKRIQWSDVMKDFTMSFDADSISMGGTDVTQMFGSNNTMEATMLQEWDDQTVVALGGAYMVTDSTVVRLGYNHASNPIPKDRLHYLFPAIEETHYTFGLGHAFSKADSVDFSMTYAPETEADMGNSAEAKMSQMNWQMMYSHKF